MLYLALHIAGNAAFALLVKVARAHRFDYPVVGLANYATAAAVSLLALGLAGLPSFDARAALFGLVNGVQYQVTYLLMYVLIGMAGIAVTSSFLRLAVAVPVLASIALWQEWPQPIQAAGLLLAGVALPLLGSSARRGRSAPAGSEPAVAEVAVPTEPVPLPLFGGRKQHATAEHEAAVPTKPVLLPAQETVHTRAPSTHSYASVALLIGATVVISGCGLLAAKAFAELGRPEQRPVYVAAVYVAATLLSACAWPWRRRFRPTHRRPFPVHGAQFPVHRGGRSCADVRTGQANVYSVLLGMMIGLVNVGQIWVLLPALAQVPGVIAFPLAAAGGLSLAALGGWLFWREPLGGRTGAGIMLAVVAAALANAR